MENENQNTGGVPYVSSRNDNVSASFDTSGQSPTSIAPTAASFPPGIAPAQPQTQSPPTSVAATQTPTARVKRRSLFNRRTLLLAIGAVILLGGGYILWQILNPASRSLSSSNSVHTAAQFGTLNIPLGELSQTGQLSLDSSRTLNINGQLKVNNGFVIAPSDKPTSGVAGQMYYDSGTNELNYYNGSGFVSLTNNPQTVTSINGTAGTLTLGGGLSLNGTQLRNSGVVSVTSASTNLAVANDGSGNITLSETQQQAGLQGQNGTTGQIAIFTSPQTIGNSLLSQSGNTINAAGDVTIAGATSINGGATIAGTLNLQQAGQETINIGETNSGVTGQIYNDGNLHITGGQNNLWLDAGGSGTIFLNAANSNPVAINEATIPAYPLEINGDVNLTAGHSYRIGGTVICSSAGCSGGGGGGVSSLNGLTGALTVANATGAGSTITINDATTAAKGIASFNSTNFSITNGAVNTAQDINSGASPTFAGVNTNSITPSGALTVGATGQSFTLQGNASSVVNASNGVNSTTLAFQSPTANVTYRFAAAAAGTYDVCTMVGNCAGVGGGVTTSGGTPGTLAIFTGSQAIGDSLLSQSGSTITVTGSLNLTTGNTYQINGSQISSANLSNDSNLAKLNGTQSFTGATNTFQNATDSTLAFSIQNASSQKIFSINTTAGTAALGQGGALNGQLVFNNSANTNTITLVPSTASANQTLTLPDGSGTICISTGNCAGAGVTLQAAYNNSGSPQITLDAVHAGLTVRDSSTPIGSNLLAVQNNAGSTTYFAVTAAGTATTGSSTVSGNINSSGGNLQTNGTTRVDNSGNLVNIGTITSGDINGQTISSSANFTGSVTVASGITTNSISPTGALTVGATGQSFTLQGNASSTVTATGGGFTTTIGFAGSPAGTVTYNFDRSVSAGTYTICTTVGNCAGSGTGVTTAGGTTNKIAKFTAGQAIGNSSISDTGSNVSITPASDTTTVFQVQNAAGHSVLNVDTSGNKIAVGNVTSAAGQGVAGNLIFADGTNDNFGATLSTATLTANRSITIPNASGTVAVSASGPLSLDAAGNLTCPSCVTSGGSGGGTAAVDSLDGLTGALTLANSTGSGTTVTINNASTSQKGIAQFNSTNFSASSGVINTIQDISSSSSPTFAGITVNTINQTYTASSGTGYTLSVTDNASSGTTTVKGQSINITGTANNTGSNTITGLDFSNVAAATNNTYYGINFGTGFNDLLRYNGTTLITGGGLINGGQLQSASVTNTALANSSLSVTAGNGLTGGGSVSLGGSTSLAVAYGSGANTAVQGNVVLNCASGSSNLTGGGNAITLGSGGTCNNIGIVNNPTFTGQLTLSGNGSAATPILSLTGTPTANATTSLVQLGGAIASGNSTANGGTYLGINLPSSGAGSAADFLDFQNNGTVALKVTSAGAIITSLSSGAVYSNGGTLTSETNLAVSRGGTGAGSFTSNGVLYGNSTGALQVTAAGTTGQCLVGNTGSAPSWTTCTGLVTLQNAYNNSTNPEITLGTASTAGLTVRDNSTPISGNLLEIQSNNGGTNYFAVSSAGITTSGNATVSGSVFSGTLDTANATGLSIGNTNATGIALGNTTNNILTTANGTLLVKPTSGHDSTTAFRVQNAAGTTSVLNVDTTNNAVAVNANNSTTSNPTLSVQQAGSGDATQLFSDAATGFYQGVDASNGDSFNINSKTAASHGSNLGNDLSSYSTLGLDSNDNEVAASKYTATSTGTLSGLSVSFGSGSGHNYSVAIYSDSSGTPGTLLGHATTGTIATPSSGSSGPFNVNWNTMTLNTPVSITSGTKYWLAVQTQHSGSDAYMFTDSGSGSTAFRGGITVGTWAASWTGNGTSNDGTDTYNIAIYGQVLASSVTDTYANSQLNLSTNGNATLRNTTNSSSAFQIQNASGSSVFDVDTANGFIGIGKSNPLVALDINSGDIALSRDHSIHFDGATDDNWTLNSNGPLTGTLINGNALSFVLDGSATEGFGIQNQAGGSLVAEVNGIGQAAFRNASNSSSAFQIQNATGTKLFNVDTAGNGVSVGTTGSSTVTLGSTSGSSTATLQGGTGGIALVTGSGSGTTGSISLTTGASSTGASGNIVIDAGSNVPTGTQLQDKTFESSAENMQAWFNVSSVAPTTAQAHTGTHSLAAVENGNPSWGIQENYPGTVSVTPGHVYAFSAWVRGTVSETIGADVVFVPGDAVHWGTVTDTTTGWTQITGTAIASAGATSEYIDFGSGDGTGSATDYFDDITITDLTATTTPYINIGTTNAQAITIGNSNQTSTTTIQGAGINLVGEPGATINVGTTNTNSVAIGDPNNGGSVTLQSVGISDVLGGGNNVITTSNNTASALQIVDDSSVTALAVSTNNVASGANAANSTLKVAKDSGTGRSINAAGTINASGADYAEYFKQAIPGALQKGDVVCLNAQSQAEACDGSSGTLIGAVSSNPGYVGNDIYDPAHPDSTALVGLLGQISVKVSDANGPIYAGDPLTMSSTPGVAVKATSAGTVLGTALENFSGGTGQISVYVHPGYFAPSATSTQQNNTSSQYVQNGSDAAFTSLNVSGQTTLGSLTVTGTATIADLTVSNLVTAALTVNGHIITGGGQPTIASESGVCDGATISISGTDTAGLVTVTTANGCTASGNLAKITFAHAFGSAPRVTLTAGSAPAAALPTYVDSGATSPTAFTIATPSAAMSGSTTYKWYYQVLQ